jgi:hypothetical protein
MLQCSLLPPSSGIKMEAAGLQKHWKLHDVKFRIPQSTFSCLWYFQISLNLLVWQKYKLLVKVYFLCTMAKNFTSFLLCDHICYVHTAMNLLVAQNSGNILSSWTISFSGTQINGVNLSVRLNLLLHYSCLQLCWIWCGLICCCSYIKKAMTYSVFHWRLLSSHQHLHIIWKASAVFWPIIFINC